MPNANIPPITESPKTPTRSIYADIVLFGGGVVRYVVVNGEVVVEDGNYASKFSGMILRKNTP